MDTQLKLDKRMQRFEPATEIADFLQIGEEDARSHLQRESESPGSTVADAWTQAAPTSIREIQSFYRETDAFLFELAVDHATDARHEYIRTIIDLAHANGFTKILDYGGGIGEDAIKLAYEGFDVYFFDVPGITFDFACFRFRRRGHNIVATSDLRRLPHDFDLIFSIEVLEHVVHPVKALRWMRSHIRKGGNILLTHSFDDVGGAHPTHLASNTRFADRFDLVLRAIGLSITGRIGPHQRIWQLERSRRIGIGSPWLIALALRVYRSLRTYRLRRR